MLSKDQKQQILSAYIKLMENPPEPKRLEERWRVLYPSGLKIEECPWTKEEDETIKEYVEAHQSGVITWANIATKLKGRTGKQCRERWMNHLDPNLNLGPWTPEEDQLLINRHKDLGCNW